MAKTLYPGVEIPDVVDRAHPIEAVETGIPVFVGLGKTEDAGAAAVPVRSFAEFEKRFGMPRYRLSEAVRLFFDNGGLQCYVSAVPGDKPSHEGLRAGRRRTSRRRTWWWCPTRRWCAPTPTAR
jgi:hypothetical protein